MKQSYDLTCKSYSFPTAAVWWSWLPCDPLNPSLCFNRTIEDSSAHLYHHNEDSRWVNLTFGETATSNNVSVHLENTMPHQRRYLNETTLRLGSALQSGFYRCSALNKYKSVQHYQVPFLVMDSDEIFSVTISTDEPTINDTIIITCKASVIEYEQIHWITVPAHSRKFISTKALHYS